MTKIKGVGRRFSNLALKKADIDLTKRAGELTAEELERVVNILQNRWSPRNPRRCSWSLETVSYDVVGKD